MMAGPRQFDALSHQRIEVHRRALKETLLLRRRTRFQHLFDGVQQALGVEEHQLVELAALRFFYFAPLQSLEIETDGGDGRLQFMGDGVDEAVMLLVAANFADQKDRIEDEAGYYGSEKNDAEKNFDALAPVEDDPAAADREGHRRQQNAEREEKINSLLTANEI